MVGETLMSRNPRLVKAGYILAGLVAGGVIAGAIGAQAATPSPSPSTSSSTTAADPHPGDNGADGVPEAQEHHGGPGGALSQSGTVTAVGTSSVTIKTSTGTTTYSVTSNSDIDKNGEATLSTLAVGDAVTFGVDSANAKQIDKLHAGDEAKNRPQHAGSDPTGSSSG
jgi:hypothetical protein